MSALPVRGVGIEGAIGPERVAEFAALAESLGYGSFWLNVLGADVQPCEALRRAVERTSRIEIGVGVFPIDKYPADQIAARLRDAGVSKPRVIIGLAGGQMKQGLLRATEDAIALLRDALPGCRIATGGYGPNTLALGGRLSDVILGNWLVPERLQWLVDGVKAGSDKAGRPMPPIYLYYRAAAGADAIARLKAELQEYRRYPVHLKHQESMGNPAWIGVAATGKQEIDRQLAPFAGRCSVVLKPLPHNAADLDELRSLLRFFAPAP